MSTKIYNGYRLSTTNIPLFARTLREHFLPTYQKLALRALVVLVVLHYRTEQAHPDWTQEEVQQLILKDMGITNHVQSPRHISPSLLANSAELLDNIQIATSQPTAQRISHLVDFLLSVTFLADPAVETPGYTYALLYTDQPAYTTIWESLPEVEPYPYWDNTDGPDELSVAEWDAHKMVWRNIFPDFRAPSVLGVTWNFLNLTEGLQLEVWKRTWLTEERLIEEMGILLSPVDLQSVQERLQDRTQRP